MVQQDNRESSWLERAGPTWIVAGVIYLAWGVVTWNYAVLPWWLVLPLGGFLLAWHGSLRHEAIHGQLAPQRWLNDAVALPPLELWLPFPNVEFQALITEIAAAKPSATACFFAGGGAVKFVKDYDAAGLKARIPLYGNGFLTDGTLQAQGASAQGIYTTLHYADSLEVARDKAFRLNYAKTYKLQPDVYAVQGYDAAQLLDVYRKAHPRAKRT